MTQINVKYYVMKLSELLNWLGDSSKREYRKSFKEQIIRRVKFNYKNGSKLIKVKKVVSSF